MREEKQLLRRQMKDKLNQLTPDQKQTIEQRLYEKLWHNDSWKAAKSIGITISQGYEWDTTPIIQKAWEQGKRVVVPKCFPKEKQLVFYQLNDFQQLESVYYGLLEPNPETSEKVLSNQIDLLLVPGLVFDKNLYRIGHGGGFYDRYLTSYDGKTISLIWREQLIEHIATKPYDIPVDDLLIDS
ncbi:5-formyltetrahydrofolate cyclo-ligase [Paraliobacillus ryukyuensis]|uniref:5-formyltetrahydrofolate cyclo-ligase n=1 Tax=Paraliobacillus ryukyuensis TaxID=200904 RepID=UPI0009A65898|nr:5-formyltetrahydrofolate cyclo-ligase [Paraliobacillus ryukyuensis]